MCGDRNLLLPPHHTNAILKVNYFLLFLVRSRRGVGRAFLSVLVYRFKLLFLRFILCVFFRGRIDNVLIGIMNGKLV